MLGSLRPGPKREPRRELIILVRAGRADAESDGAEETLRDVGETVVTSADQLGALLARSDPAMIVADASVDAEKGADVLAEIAALRPSAVPVILGPQDAPSGARTFVMPKPVDRNALRMVARLVMECAGLARRVQALEEEKREWQLASSSTGGEPGEDGGLEPYEGIVTRSPSMRAIIATLRAIESSHVTVLIQGETGTGKELVARAIHARSPRQRAPLVSVNVGALPDQLRESELFGHVRGAFTGASETRAGLFAEAHRGTIFLDEIGEASPALQVALLRALEDGTILPVGADRPRTVDVRVIAATNEDLGELVRAGRFRRDLYYRLNVFPLHLPALRERREDIFPLAEHFLGLASRAAGYQPTGISRDARLALEGHSWEGNVRELRSAMERAALLCNGNLVVAAHLSLGGGAHGPTADRSRIDLPPRGAALSDLEREIFSKTLVLAEGNQSRAARMLGLHESTFRFRLRKAGLAHGS